MNSVESAAVRDASPPGRVPYVFSTSVSESSTTAMVLSVVSMSTRRRRAPSLSSTRPSGSSRTLVIDADLLGRDRARGRDAPDRRSDGRLGGRSRPARASAAAACSVSRERREPRADRDAHRNENATRTTGPPSCGPERRSAADVQAGAVPDRARGTADRARSRPAPGASAAAPPSAAREWPGRFESACRSARGAPGDSDRTRASSSNCVGSAARYRADRRPDANPSDTCTGDSSPRCCPPDATSGAASPAGAGSSPSDSGRRPSLTSGTTAPGSAMPGCVRPLPSCCAGSAARAWARGRYRTVAVSVAGLRSTRNCGPRRAEALVHFVPVALRRRIEAAHVEQRLIGRDVLAPAAQIARAVHQQVRRAERIGERERDRPRAAASGTSRGRA